MTKLKKTSKAAKEMRREITDLKKEVNSSKPVPCASWSWKRRCRNWMTCGTWWRRSSRLWMPFLQKSWMCTKNPKLQEKERSIVNDCPRLISMNRKTENYKMRRKFRRIFCESMNVEDTVYDRDSLLGKVYADPA